MRGTNVRERWGALDDATRDQLLMALGSVPLFTFTLWSTRVGVFPNPTIWNPILATTFGVVGGVLVYFLTDGLRDIGSGGNDE